MPILIDSGKISFMQLLANLKLNHKHLNLANDMATRLGVQLFSEETSKKKDGLTEKGKERFVAKRRHLHAKHEQIQAQKGGE